MTRTVFCSREPFVFEDCILEALGKRRVDARAVRREHLSKCVVKVVTLGPVPSCCLSVYLSVCLFVYYYYYLTNYCTSSRTRLG